MKKIDEKQAAVKDGESLNAIDTDENQVLVEARLADLMGINYDGFPDDLRMKVLLDMCNPDEYITISKSDSGYYIYYYGEFLTKFWDGFIGQFYYLQALKHLLEQSDIADDALLEGDNGGPMQELSFNKKISRTDDLFIAVNQILADVKAAEEKLNGIVDNLKNQLDRAIGLN